jgi:hypothetical protein
MTSVAVGLTSYGLANSSFTPERPKLNVVSYGINHDTHEAYWLSSDAAPDAWTQQFFDADAPREEFREFAWRRSDRVMKAAAPIAPELPGPQFIILSDTTVNGVRELVMHIDSPAGAAKMDVAMVSETAVIAATVFGRDVPGDDRDWRLQFNLFPAEGAIVTLRVAAGAAVRLQARETFYGIPEMSGITPRPDWMIPMPNTVNHGGSALLNNHTWVVRTVEF